MNNEQAQAGEPEVVAYLCFHTRYEPQLSLQFDKPLGVRAFESDEVWDKPLITLQSHREAMAKLEKLANEQAEINAKMTREKYPFVHIRIDASEAEKESAVRRKLIELGWASPEAIAKKDAEIAELRAALRGCVDAIQEPSASLLLWVKSVRDAITKAQEALK